METRTDARAAQRAAENEFRMATQAAWDTYIAAGNIPHRQETAETLAAVDAALVRYERDTASARAVLRDRLRRIAAEYRAATA